MKQGRSGALSGGDRGGLARSSVRRHVVLVLVQELDRSVTSGIRYARGLRADVVRCVHVVVDPVVADRLARDWDQLGLSPLTLELREVPDRRLDRAVLEAAIGELDGDTHTSVVVPGRVWRPRWWALIGHDRTALALVRSVAAAGLDHVTVTVVPFAVRTPSARAARLRRGASPRQPGSARTFLRVSR